MGVLIERNAAVGVLPDAGEIKITTPAIGRWIDHPDMKNFVTPGGTPVYVCSRCGGSPHLHGAEYPKRKLICLECGSINIYPWEKCYEEDEANAQ